MVATLDLALHVVGYIAVTELVAVGAAYDTGLLHVNVARCRYAFEDDIDVEVTDTTAHDEALAAADIGGVVNELHLHRSSLLRTN